MVTTNIGTTEQWAPIFDRHPGLPKALNGLIDVTEGISASVPLQSRAHYAIFALRNVCVEECWEVLLLAANNYPSGAAKIIRALYERALTMAYLSQNPDKAQRFMDYAAIQTHKILRPALKIVSEEKLNEKIQPMTISDIREQYELAKPSFQVTECKKCETSRLAPSWDLDITSMAERVQEGFPELLLSAYTLPTLHMHATAGSAFARLTEIEKRMVFSYQVPPDSVDLYILLALQLMLIVHKVSATFFSMPFSKQLLAFEEAFQNVILGDQQSGLRTVT